jgi:protein tyrosine kinase modulator
MRLFEGTDELQKNIDAMWRLVIRHRWQILLTACTIILATAGVSRVLPNQYVSEATIIVEQQMVPERYVTPTSTLDLSSALQAMEQDVLSSTQLLKIIEDFSLYASERKRHAPEELVELMRENIEITPLEGADTERRTVNSFRISFTADRGLLAQQVTSRLTSLFIEENLKTREQQAIGTTNFLESQLVTAQNELQEQEEHLKNFKMKNLGELPEQEQGNLAILSGLQMELQNTAASLARAQEQHAYLSSLLTQYGELPSAGEPLTGAQIVTPTDSLQTELNRLNSERSELLARDLPQHPDVVRVDQEISETKALLDQIEKAPRSTAAVAAPNAQGFASTHGATVDTATAQVKSQLEANRLEIEDLSKDQKRFQDEVTEYQSRLNLTPVRDQELSAILNDYNAAKQNYEDLLNKKTQSELASNLEQQQQGQQFRIVDPPSLPSKPNKPNRLIIGAGGVAGGLALGLSLAILIEIKKAAFYTEVDIKQRFTVPLVLGIPALASPAEIRKRARWKVLEWAGASALVLVVLIVELYVCWRG